jgi:hypothetical protein
VNKRREVSTGIGISAIRKSEFSRSCALGQQQSRNPDGIWIVHSCGRVAVIKCHQEKLDRRLHWRIRDRDFEMSNSLDNKNPEIAICDLTAAVKSSSDLDR